MLRLIFAPMLARKHTTRNAYTDRESEGEMSMWHSLMLWAASHF